jgi:hypothetical protein
MEMHIIENNAKRIYRDDFACALKSNSFRNT